MRARLIKPGYFKSEELADLPWQARILFAGLWCLADREGRLKDKPRRIRAEILPFDDIDTNALLDELAGAGFIVRYGRGDNAAIQVVNFLKHQAPHYKEPASDIAPPPGHQDSQVVTFGVSNEQRARILTRDGNACQHCGTTDNLTIDHIHPRSRGGSGEDDNLQTLCRRCNSAKNNRLASSMVGSTSDQHRVMENAPWPPVPDPDPVPTIPVPDPDPVEDGTAEAASDDAVLPASLTEMGSGWGLLREEPTTPAPDWPDATWIDAAFDQAFWPAYPRKTHKTEARACWRKLLKRQPTYETALALAETILEVLRDQSDAWTDPRITPHAATYLNGERWTDEQIIPTGRRERAPPQPWAP
jgi:hypothetical protein